eukprot:11103697-Ditylum_brightwellii.AAC.1
MEKYEFDHPSNSVLYGPPVEHSTWGSRPVSRIGRDVYVLEYYWEVQVQYWAVLYSDCLSHHEQLGNRLSFVFFHFHLEIPSLTMQPMQIVFSCSVGRKMQC